MAAAEFLRDDVALDWNSARAPSRSLRIMADKSEWTRDVMSSSARTTSSAAFVAPVSSFPTETLASLPSRLA